MINILIQWITNEDVSKYLKGLINVLKEGFGNLTVIERGKYHGGYTCFVNIGVDVRRGDGFLAMDVQNTNTW